MFRPILATAAALLSVAATYADAPPKELVEKLTTAIREHCPDAKFETTENPFVAKHGTMKFTVHARSKTGEIFPRTHEQEGPNFKGFYLSVTLNEGKYEGAAVVPQTLQGPYYPSFINAVPAGERDEHYFIVFSYGSRLDPGLKKAIFEALPRTSR